MSASTSTVPRKLSVRIDPRAYTGLLHLNGSLNLVDTTYHNAFGRKSLSALALHGTASVASSTKVGVDRPSPSQPRKTEEQYLQTSARDVANATASGKVKAQADVLVGVGARLDHILEAEAYHMVDEEVLAIDGTTARTTTVIESHQDHCTPIRDEVLGSLMLVSIP